MATKINIKATNISLTPSISEYIAKKIETLDKFFGEKEALVNVEVGRTTKHHKSGDIFKAEIHISAAGQDYYAVSETEDLYAAIDEVKNEMARELSSKIKKAAKLLKRGRAKIKNWLKGSED